MQDYEPIMSFGEDVAAMYRAFRGRDPEVRPLLEERGLTGGATVTPGVKAKP